jgi:hypothetical protein
MTGARVLGVDLSLTGTGLAGNGWADTVVPPGPPKRNAAWRKLSTDEQRWALTEYRHVRLAHVLGAIRDRYLTTAPDLVVLEGLSYDSFDTDRQLAGLSWQVRHSLWRLGIPYATVPPSCLKQFATGNGAAAKADVVRAAKARFGWFDGDDNAADATWLMAVGHAALGEPLYGLLSDVQQRAMAKCGWPDLEPLRRSQRHPSVDAWAATGAP